MTLVLNNPDKPHLKRWTKREYFEAVERGVFHKQRIFLYRGELIEMPPMGALHAFGVANLTEWLSRTVCSGVPRPDSIPIRDAGRISARAGRRYRDS